MITLKVSPRFATDVYEALDSVLTHCDVHADDAEHLEVMKDVLEYHIEKHADHATDVDWSI